MKKLKKEEIEWFRNNEDEFIRSLSDTFMELDYQINLNKDELDSLPTPDDRRKWVMDMLKKIRDREVKEPLSEEIKQKSKEYQKVLKEVLK